MINLSDYSRIIIWGAGNLGRKLGAELILRSFPVDCYWDLRAEDIKQCNSIPVVTPFTDLESIENTLIIFAVSSGLIQSASIEKIKQYGCDYVSGMKLYQDILCPNNLGRLDITECCNRIECNVDTCSRLNSLIFEKYYSPDKILLETGYLFITQRCSLKCKYCIAYMNSYPVDKRFDYEADSIIADIDALSEACSFIKRIVVYGGEPFLHPQIDRIVGRLKEKDNIGIIDIVTNGLFRQPENSISSLKGENVRIEFSNYQEALSDAQIKVRDSNYEKMKELGLNPFMHGVTPEWIKPRTFYNKNLSTSEKESLKAHCDYFVRNESNKIKQSMVIANGRIYPCRMACSITTLGVADYREDYIVIEKEPDLVAAIERLYEKPFYDYCGHCESKQGEITPIAGEQGFDERYLLS